MKKCLMLLFFVFLIFIFNINYIYALEVDFACPSEVSVGEEFGCGIKFEGDYDVKADILCRGGRSAQIWNGGGVELYLLFYKKFQR